MHTITIIGTRPACPRCSLLYNAITKMVDEMGIEATIQHFAYTEKEATACLSPSGLKAGTAKDVSKQIGIEIEFERMWRIEYNEAREENREYKRFNTCNWSYELDLLLRPFESRAKEAGIIMTPILWINGQIKSSGSVPRLHKIEEWLTSLRAEDGLPT